MEISLSFAAATLMYVFFKHKKYAVIIFGNSYKMFQDVNEKYIT